jgi:hypothetical protein
MLFLNRFELSLLTENQIAKNNKQQPPGEDDYNFFSQSFSKPARKLSQETFVRLIAFST